MAPSSQKVIFESISSYRVSLSWKDLVTWRAFSLSRYLKERQRKKKDKKFFNYRVQSMISFPNIFLSR